VGTLTPLRPRRRGAGSRTTAAAVLVALALILPANAIAANAAARSGAASAGGSEAGLHGLGVRGTGILPNFAATGSNLVRLQAGAFDPLADPAPAGAAIPQVPDAVLPAGVPSYFLAQVANGQFATATSAISGAGASVTSIVPDDTYVVRATPAQRVAFAASPAIRWSAFLQPAWRVPVAANGLPNLLDLAGPRNYRVYAFRTDSRATTLASALDAIPGVQLVRDGGVAVDVKATAAQIGAMAAIPYVQWVSTKPIAVPLNYDARWVVDSGVRDLFATTAPNGAAATRLSGAGVTAADADTPLNYTNNSAGFAHVAFRDGCNAKGLNCALADYTQQQSGNDDASMEAVQVNHPGKTHRKMAAYFDLGGVGVETISADGDAHGSHTAGTIDGDAGVRRVYDGYDGLAPAAHHVHQEILDSSGGLATPTDYYELFRQAYRTSAPAAVDNTGALPDPSFYGGANYDPLHDARTHNNSYGLTIAEVDPFSEAIVLDQFVWDHEDMAIAVAAGNSGPATGTIGSPAVAKNNFSSAASSNGRQPMASIDSVTNFSSHGPTGDGRYGITVATPGEVITSVKGGTADGYHYLQGTSMSTPVLTGALTLARQYFWSGYGPSGGQGFAVGRKSATRAYDPSAALLKAALVSGATRMRGWYTGDDGSDLESTQRGQYPSAGQGFGLVNLDRSLSFKGGPLTSWFHDVYRSGADAFDVADSGATTRSYPIEVAAGAPLNVALAWTDAPDAMPAGTPALVNDLQLTLTDPNGNEYVGNNFNSRANPSTAVAEVPSGSAAPDSVNNVEKVAVANPVAGTWTVHVAAARVALGKQGFALSANGVIGAAGSHPKAGPPHQVDSVPGSPHISNLTATPVSADTVKLSFTTDEPTTAAATGTVTTESHTFGDDYQITAAGYYRVDTPPVEDSPAYAGVRVLSTKHEITLTGFDAGSTRTFAVAATDIEGSPPTAANVTFTTPRNTFQPASSDEGQLAKSGEPAGFAWRTGKQFYAGAVPASTTADADALLGAFMFRVPGSFDVNQITGAEVQLQSAHDLASAVTDDPTYHLDLLDDSAKPAWGTQTYDQIETTPKVARLNPVTALHTGVSRYHFAFSCDSIAALKASLSNLDANGMRDAPFRWDVTNPGASLFSREFGFNRRSHGLDLRPKLVLFTAADPAAPPLAPCDPAAPAPAITNVGIHPGDATTNWTVTWRTNVASDSLVLFRQRGTTAWKQVGSRGLSQIHQVEVRGIDPDLRYEFGIRSTGCNGKATTDDNGGKGYAFRIPPVPTQPQSAPLYFHGTASDDANRQAGTPSATFDATAPAAADADATQTGNVLLSDSSLAGDPNSAYWLAPATATYNGQLHISWYWSTNNADSIVTGDVEDITVWADPDLATNTGTLLGSASVPITLGLSPTLNTSIVPVHGTVAHTLLIQVTPHYLDTSAGVTVHYNSPATASSFTTPVGAPPPPANRPVVGPQPPASAGDHDLNLAAVVVDSPATAADVAAGTAMNCPP
jgi:hypothetical protein